MEALSQAILNATSADINVRKPAEETLKQMEANYLPDYLCGLCMELGDENKLPQARQLAGLVLKGTLVAKDETARNNLARRWLNLAQEVRAKVKEMLCHILKSNQKNIRSTAALVIGQIARIEVPEKMWNELVPMLVQNITSNQGGDFLRQSSFEALGYVCEECPDALQEHSNNVLTAIHNGMRAEEKNHDIKLAATKALANSLEFVKANMERENDRRMIMQMVFGVTQCEEEKVRAAAYECLIQISSSYYQFLGESIAHIFDLTKHAMAKESDEVAPSAIEIWSTICEEEIDIIEETEEAQSKGQVPTTQCQNFISAAQAQLLPLLLMSLTKQSEDVDDDTFDSAKAAGTCIGLIATCTRDAVVPIVLPFVQEHINSTNWRFKEAAILSFGAILDGPSPGVLSPMVSKAFPLLLHNMKDSMPLIKDTTAWTIGRVCSFCPETINNEVLEHLMVTLVGALNDCPKVACASAWAIHNLADVMEINDEAETTPLSRYFEGLIRALLQISQRPDAGEANLLGTAYETINVLISKSAKDRFELIGHLIPPLMDRLKATVMSQGLTGQEREKQNEVQGLLCVALGTIISKLGRAPGNPIHAHADNLMMCFLRVLETKNATIQEDALMAIGTIASCVEKGFEKYMSTFIPFLELGLKNADEYHVCIQSVGVVSEIAAAMGETLFPYADGIMNQLLRNLQDGQIERSVKPHIISCMADISLSLGCKFERYINYVMEMLVSASAIKLDTTDYDDAEYLISLRSSVLEAYTGILQGLADDKVMLFGNYVEKVVPFIDLIASEEDKDESVVKAAVGVIGDMASRLGKPVAQMLNRPSVQQLVMVASNSRNESVRKDAKYTQDEMTRVLQS